MTDALAANPPEYLMLPEPLQPKQLHNLHIWPSQGQTQVLQGSLEQTPVDDLPAKVKIKAKVNKWDLVKL